MEKMSVERKCSMFKGWVLNEEDFEDKSGEFIELLLANEHLHWIDGYNDDYPKILGVESRKSFYEGEIYLAEELFGTFSEEKERTLKKVAEEFFGIKTPPKVFLALCVY